MRNSFIHSFRADYIDKDHSLAYKGIFAVLILLVHIGSAMANYYGISQGSLLTPLSYLAVSGFLFLSGYGLTLSANKRKDAYFSGFLMRRVVPLYGFYLAFAVLYCIFYVFFLKVEITWENVLYTLFIGKTYVGFGWYVQCIVFLYLSFYLCYRFGLLRKPGVAPLAVITPYLLVCICLRLDFIYIQCIFGFLCGFYYYQHKGRVDKALSCTKGYAIMQSIAAVLVVVLLGISVVTKNVFVNRLCRLLLGAVFPVAFMTLASRLPMKNKITMWLGKISLEIYIVQGLFIQFFGEYRFIKNIFVYIILVCVCTFAGAIVTNYLWAKVKQQLIK